MDKTEYAAIVHMYIDDVYRAALSCCRSREDAEDAVQNTFLKLLTTDIDFSGGEHVRRWLIRVAVNECRSELRSFRRRSVSYIEELGSEPSAPEDDRRLLLYEIGRLPVKYSAPLHLHYYEGYSCKEIADLLHISESNVQTRLQRARKMLRKNLEEG